MNSLVAHETTVCGEQKVGIRNGQPGESVKSNTVHGDKHGSRKVGLMEEFNPMGGMESSHVEFTTLLMTNPSHTLYFRDFITSRSCQQTTRLMEVNGTYMGCEKTIGDMQERPGIDASSTSTGCRLEFPSVKEPFTNRKTRLTMKEYCRTSARLAK
jgi:hypothetical protein